MSFCRKKGVFFLFSEVKKLKIELRGKDSFLRFSLLFFGLFVTFFAGAFSVWWRIDLQKEKGQKVDSKRFYVDTAVSALWLPQSTLLKNLTRK
jgi:hypothetical protein